MRRVTGTAALLTALLFTLTFVNAAPQSPKGGYGNAGAITADELSTYLHFLASDQLEGRNTPSRGYDTASLYIASHLRQWGVKPLGSTTGTKGPLQAYFMPIELVSSQPDPAGMTLTLTAPAVAGRGGAGAAPAAPRTFPATISRAWCTSWASRATSKRLAARAAVSAWRGPPPGSGSATWCATWKPDSILPSVSGQAIRRAGSFPVAR